MWSAAVLDPALPGRRLAARNSVVLSHHTPIGWYPNVRLYVGAAFSFSLWVTTMVASTSSTTVDPRSRPAHLDAGTPPGRCDHTCRRVRARATWIFLLLPAVTSSRVRHTVGAEATGPSAAVRCHRTTMPGMDSPPSASITATSINT